MLAFRWVVWWRVGYWSLGLRWVVSVPVWVEFRVVEAAFNVWWGCEPSGGVASVGVV